MIWSKSGYGSVVVFLFLVSGSCWAVEPGAEEMAGSKAWFEEYLGAEATGVPFSFVYEGKASSEILAGWKREFGGQELAGGRRASTVSWTEPKSGLVVRCEAIWYPDFPTVEWVLYFKNGGGSDTALLEKIQPLDLSLPAKAEGDFVLRYNRGSGCGANDFEPKEVLLSKGVEARLAAETGFSTGSMAMPYFNLKGPEEGKVIALGWPGQWAAGFTRGAEGGLHIQGGQELTHFRLRPGEEVRSPQVVMEWYRGDWIRGQNIWRRWMRAHNEPRPGGQALKPVLSACCATVLGFTGMTEEKQYEYLNRYLEEKMPLDRWWIDAGWFPVPEGAPWWNYGTWTPDPVRFPNGMKPVMDYAHAKGLQTVLWFCTETVRPGTWLEQNHPQWLVPQLEYGQRSLLNLANPEAHQWAVEHINRSIDEYGVDVYRHDNEIGALPLWWSQDAEDRQGITEIQYVTNFLSLYDEILRRHPKMLIDNCCAGGRRNDVATLRRSVPLWRSDVWGAPTPMQSMTYGLAMWIPYFGHMTGYFDPYTFRSNMYPSGIMDFDVLNRNQNYDLLRKLLGQWRMVADNFLGDYYPLTPYSLEETVWMAWQFDRPEAGEGMVQVFRRPGNDIFGRNIKLQGLKPEASYTLKDMDREDSWTASGKELMEKGIHLVIEQQPAAVIITYKAL